MSMLTPPSSRRSTRRSVRLPVGLGLAVGATLLAVGSSGAVAAASSPAGPAGAGPWSASTVYTETNQASGNTVLGYRAEPGGALNPIGQFSTGGTGTGVGPASQGGVTLSPDGHWLAVVNGGSNSISVYLVGPGGRLQLVDVTGSGGVDPISVTINGSWVYALNAGNSATPANIAGFNLFGGPFFHHPVGVQALNPAASSPEDIGFTPGGRDLVVTEKASSTVDVFPVNGFGLAQPPVTTTIPGAVGPYGFTFTRGGAIAITEAATNALATFWISPRATLQPISVVGDGQLAPCWVVLTPNGQEAFVANAHNGTISAYGIAPNGALRLISPAVQASPGDGDTDLAIAGNDTLYVSDQPDFDASSITPTGVLAPSQTVASALPAGTFGLAATGASPYGF